MAFGNLDQDDDDDVLNEINMIPLIDVMLVLLIVFMIAVPVIQHAVKVDLPRAPAEAADVNPETVVLSVDAKGAYYWNDTAVSDEELERRLLQAAKADLPPALHIRGDQNVRYERVVQAMAAAQKAGIAQLGFVTDP